MLQQKNTVHWVGPTHTYTEADIFGERRVVTMHRIPFAYATRTYAYTRWQAGTTRSAMNSNAILIDSKALMRAIKQQQ